MSESVCYRHPGREAYIVCQRCQRPICPECMRDAAVGFQCPECVATGAKAVRQPKTVAGGALPGRPGAATLTLIGINVAVFLVGHVLRVGELDVFGALIGERVYFDGHLVDGVAGGEVWRLLTAAFLHATVWHLGFNMLALYLFGPFVENILGTARFVAFYLAAAVFSGAVVFWLTDPYTVTVGASGAVFALFGCALVVLIRARQDVRTLVALLVINAVLSLRDGISWQGHLGGFVAGAIFALVVTLAPRGRGALAQSLAVAVLLCATVVITVLRAMTLP